ncbi:MAG: universal stress protein [Synechococcaceae cyanobacterium RM1_1_27]|nr:universal stress protein [Synechococcaceae cyanobacterium RM1_1_27]
MASNSAAAICQSVTPPRIKTLIVGVDGSGLAEQMTQTLMKLPHFATTNLLLVHVVRPQITSSVAQTQWQAGQDLLNQSRDSFPTNDPIQTRLVEGDPKRVLFQLAKTEPDPMLVMGTSQHNRFAAIFENSISQYIFQMAQCPMLMIRDGLYLKRIQRIMVALNSSVASQESLQMAIQMAKDPRGRGATGPRPTGYRRHYPGSRDRTCHWSAQSSPSQLSSAALGGGCRPRDCPPLSRGQCRSVAAGIPGSTPRVCPKHS